jgi:hypothetical protein
VFIFTGGLESGAFRMAFGPDSMLYVGMLGGRNDNDGYPKNQTSGTRVDYGLQKLRYGGATVAFEMRAVRARPAGFEIEFSMPVDTTVAKAAGSYTIQSYYMQPASGYGAGAKVGSSTLAPSEIRLSADGLKVYLALAGIPLSTPTQQRVVYFKLNGFKAASGASPWATEAWYTLNGAGTGAPFDPPIPLQPPTGVARAGSAGASPRFGVTLRDGALRVAIPSSGYREVRVLDASGRLLRVAPVSGAGECVLPAEGMRGVAIVRIVGAAPALARAFVLP